MRYYSIEIEGGPKWTSHPGGKFDPNALNVEFDLNITPSATPGQGCVLKVWGVGLKVISQANQLYNKSITIRGGMQQGLPLAKPSQSGILIDGGLITRPFGSWNMTDQALEMVISSGGKRSGQPAVNPHAPNSHIAMPWTKGQPIGTALKQALTSAFPGAKIVMNLTQNIVAPQDQHSFHANIQQLAYFAGRISQQIGGAKYPGVSIVQKGNTIKVTDSAKSGGKAIAATDLVGQPIWIDVGVIQVKTVQRADINVMDTITLPKTWVNSTAQAATNTDQQGIQGSFQVIAHRAIGNYRMPMGDAWVSIFDCAQS